MPVGARARDTESGLSWGAGKSKKPPYRQDVLGNGGADGEHGFVHNLTQCQVHRDTAKKVGVQIAKTPVGGKQVDHARRGGTSSAGGVCGGLNDDPRSGVVIASGRWRGFDERCG